MVAFLATLIITGIMVAVVLFMARRRPPGTPMTWGEAMLAATFMFALMLMLYGVVPNQWIQWADKDLGWRSDSFGVPTPFGRLWANGLTFGGRGRLLISAQVVRDVIAAGIYIVGFVGQLAGWLWWQKTRGRKAAPAATIETSAFGRPIVRKA